MFGINKYLHKMNKDQDADSDLCPTMMILINLGSRPYNDDPTRPLLRKQDLHFYGEY